MLWRELKRSSRDGGIRPLFYSLLSLVVVIVVAGCSETPSSPPKINPVSCTQYDRYLHIGATVNTQGDTRRAVRHGDVVFAADGVSGIQVIDVTDPGKPLIVSTIRTASGATDIVILGNTMYAATIDDGILIYDVTDPLSPAFRSGLPLTGQALGLAVVDTLLYVADDVLGMPIISVNDPNDPQFVGVENSVGSAQDVIVDGSTAFVSDDALGLRVVDVSIPSSPTLRTSLTLSGEPRGLAITGKTLLVAAGFQVVAIDVGDPDRPVITGNIPTPNGAQDIEIVGTRGFVAELFGGVRLLDLTDPTAPVSIGSLDTPGQAKGVNAQGDLLLVSDPGFGASHDGVELIPITTPEVAPVLATRPTPGSTGVSLGAFLVGEALYVCDGPAGVAIANISDPERPRFVNGLSIPGAHHMAVDGQTAYVVGDNEIVLLDVSNPFSPSPLGPVLPAANRVTVSDSLAFLSHDVGMTVYRVNPTGTPQLLATIGSTQAVYDAVVAGNYAYAAWGGAGVQVLDLYRLGIQNPIVWSVATDAAARGIAVIDHYLVVAISVRGVQIFDIQNPAQPVAVAGVETPGTANFVIVEGNAAYVADETGGVQIIDLRDPTDPRRSGTLVVPSRVSGVDVDGFFLYAVARDDGLIIARSPCNS